METNNSELDNSSITFHSVEYIREQMSKKIRQPYFASQNTAEHIITDMDHTPYSRWYRGVYYYPDPIVMEREAGYRKINNDCYNVVMPRVSDPPLKNCFESACTTTFPCILKQSPKYVERELHNEATNNNCLVQYR